jgi:hypothetical protein
MTLMHRRQPSTVGITMPEKHFPQFYRPSIVAVLGCLLLFSGCKKEAPNPVDSTPPGALVDLHGIVVDAQVSEAPADPLPGATVWLDSATATARSCVSDSLGAFAFTKVTAGTHTLRVSHASLGGVDTTVVVSANSWLFYLRVSTRRATLAGVAQALDRASGTRTPLAGALVSLDPGTLKAQVVETGASGGFSFSRVSEGVHHLRVSQPSVVTLDTQVVASMSMRALSLTAEALPIIEVFPLAVGARWVYDYKHTYSEGQDWTPYDRARDEGRVTFTVSAVADEGARKVWTIQEDDDLMHYDTAWAANLGYQILPEVAVKQSLIFSMYEEKTSLHTITSDSCSPLWRVPWPYRGYGDPAYDVTPTLKYDYVLTRYAIIAGDSVMKRKPFWGGSTDIKESRTLVRDIGLVSCYMWYNRGGVMSPSIDAWWGTLRSYTPGQGAGPQKLRRGLGRNHFNPADQPISHLPLFATQ